MTTVFIALFGLVVGSFLNVIITRLRFGIPFFRHSRSLCVHCHKKIAWYDNIPVLSFVVLGGVCRQCRKPIGWQYPLVELTAAVLGVWLYTVFGLSIDFFIAALFTVFLLLIFVYDARYYIIPDVFSIPALIVALGVQIWQAAPWQSLVWGMVIGGGFFLLQFVVSRGRWIGGGDIRLGAVMGAMLGWKLVLVALAIAYVTGAIVALGLLLLRKKRMSSELPFGTFLTSATVITFVYGEQILGWYLRVLGVSI